MVCRASREEEGGRQGERERGNPWLTMASKELTGGKVLKIKKEKIYGRQISFKFTIKINYKIIFKNKLPLQIKSKNHRPSWTGTKKKKDSTIEEALSRLPY